MSSRSSWIRSKCRVGEKILDIGSASGFTFRGTELEPYVTFVDLDLYNMPNFFQMDAHHLTFPDQSFNVAILGELLEHVENPVQVLREARRVAKRLIITVPDEANWAKEHHPYSSVQDLIKNEGVSNVKELAEKAGPEIVKFHEDNYYHCFHNRFYTEESFRSDLEKAGIFDYDFKRLQYQGWSFFTVEVPRLTSKLPSDISPKELEAQFDRDYFSWNGKGQAKGYRGQYADFPENLKFVEYIKSLKPINVLEAGCAYGFLTKRLNDAGISAEGFDVSSFAYKMRVTNKVKTASILDLSCYKDKQFDLVVSIELLEHIREKDIDQALRELSRVSKRGVHWIAYKEVDDIFQTKDITHINIKPYQWWVDKMMLVCGSSHRVIRKETEWYPNSVKIPKGQIKVGLNIGCFTAMLLNTESTAWHNIDALDLKQYAAAYGYNFIQKDIRQGLPFNNNSINYIIASHFLEHLTLEETQMFLSECHRTLKPEGIMRLSVPDANLLINKYKQEKLGYFDEINSDCEKMETQLDKLNTLLWPGHKTVYDEKKLNLLLKKTSFKSAKQSLNKSSRPDLMNQIFDYHADLSIFIEGTPIKIKEDIPLYKQYLQGLIDEGREPLNKYD